VGSAQMTLRPRQPIEEIERHLRELGCPTEYVDRHIAELRRLRPQTVTRRKLIRKVGRWPRYETRLITIPI
jgi:hypothetical protein